MNIIVSLLLFLSPSFVQSETNSLMNSYRLTDRILIVGTGEMEMDMVAAVNTSKGIVVIDTGMSPSLTAKHRSLIEKEFGRSDFKYVINTHHHSDHVNGNQVFKDTIIIAHQNAAAKMYEENDKEEIADSVEYTRERNERRNRLKETLKKDSVIYKKLRDRIYVSGIMCDDYETIYQAAFPTLTFSDHLSLDMGDLTIELIYFGPGFHSDGDIIVSIPDQKTIFTGDIILRMDRYQRVTSKYDIGSWIACLDKVFKNNSEIKHVVAYHAGVLPVTVLRDFYDTLKKMETAQREKESAVDRLRVMISGSNVREAIKRFEAQFLKKRNEHYYIWEGDLLILVGEFLEKEKYTEAMIILKMYEKIFPNSTRVLFNQTEIFTKQGKNRLAVEAYQKMLEIDPTNYFYLEKIFHLKTEFDRRRKK
jgi:glyoxylase-like metal-dependent hydrolase (beta-lactamase superfamily II)